MTTLTKRQREAIEWAITWMDDEEGADEDVRTLRSILDAPSADDAGISKASIAACALMIKGICMTHTQDVWTTKIAERIEFMLSAAPTPEDAPSAAQGGDVDG